MADAVRITWHAAARSATRASWNQEAAAGGGTPNPLEWDDGSTVDWDDGTTVDWEA